METPRHDQDSGGGTSARPSTRGDESHRNERTSPANKVGEVLTRRERPRDGVAPSRRKVVTRGVAVLVAGLALYFLFPRVVQVFASWPRLSTLNPIWLLLAVVAEAASFACSFALKRIALGTPAWFPVVTAGLTGNAITNIFPGADATGAAVEYRLLARAGIDTDNAVGGLTAFSVLGIGSLLGLPLFSLPAILFGAPVPRGLVHAAYLGIGAFVVFALGAGVVIATDRPLAVFGRLVERIWNRFFGRKHHVDNLDHRLLTERDVVIEALGKKWHEAVLLSVGRLGFDFLALLAALTATGADPSPSLVLLAYSAATVIGLLPLTPGGLGIVEASLSGLLVLAEVRPGYAILATLAYRITSYWLPTAAGLLAYILYRRRYGSPSSSAVATGQSIDATRAPADRPAEANPAKRR